MLHLNDRLLEKLIDGSAVGADVLRIQRHTESCRACARRLEEWRDNYPEVDQHFPELALEQPPAATVTPSGLLLLPREEQARGWGAFDPTTALWIGVVVLALVVGYGANRLHQRAEGMVTQPSDFRDERDPVRGVAAGVPQGPSAGTSARESSGTAARTGAGSPRRAEPTPPGVSARPGAGTRPAPSRSTMPISARFQAVPAPEAAQRLGGRLRLLGGATPDHIEIGPASAVPGAHRGLDVVRVVYRTEGGGWILLDQQIIPADSSGFRPIDDPALESGETAFGTSSSGVSVATWFDEDGYRISVAVQASVDSLKRLVQRIR